TVTAMCGEIARATGRPTFVGGNLGTPLITAVDTSAASADGIVVVELSSFQLETCDTFHPRAAVLTNLAADHLDRYASLDDYGVAKLRIVRRMTSSEPVVVNGDDDWLLHKLSGRDYDVAFFSTGAGPERHDLSGWLDAEHFCVRAPGGKERYPLVDL